MAKNQFSFHENSHVIEILKNTFPMEFFDKIWLKVEEHEWIYIFEIKFEEKYSVSKYGRPKQILWYCAIMLMYANERKNGAANIIFFHQKCVSNIYSIEDFSARSNHFQHFEIINGI